ncbi:MAG: GatB/YqeY domain-containing protein [Gammaproteobacteria bacterium]|jgi:uncharacterized protein YqeY
MSLKAQIQSDMKTALKAGEKERLSVIRMLLAAIQSKEIDERAELSDNDVLQVVEKLIKQRKDSARQFADAGRSDREAQELAEAEILQAYLPEQLSAAELEALVSDIIAATGAQGMKDMGKVMGQLKEKAQGRADMGTLSALVKSRLT